MDTFYTRLHEDRSGSQALDDDRLVGLLNRAMPHDEGTIGDFRQLVLDHLGNLAVLILDVRLAGGETRWLVRSPAIGTPSEKMVTKMVRAIVRLVQEAASEAEDPTLLVRIQRAMEEEERDLANGQARGQWNAGSRARELFFCVRSLSR